MTGLKFVSHRRRMALSGSSMPPEGSSVNCLGVETIVNGALYSTLFEWCQAAMYQVWP